MAAAFWPLNAEASNDICPVASTDSPRSFSDATEPDPDEYCEMLRNTSVRV